MKKLFLTVILCLVSAATPTMGFAKVAKPLIDIDRIVDDVQLRSLPYRERSAAVEKKRPQKDYTIHENEDGTMLVTASGSNSTMTLSEEGELLSVDQYDLASELAEDDSEVGVVSVEDRAWINEFVARYIPLELQHVEMERITNGFIQVICSESNPYGIYNPHNAYKFIVDPETRIVVGLERYEEYTVEKPPIVQEPQAIHIAVQFLNEFEGKERRAPEVKVTREVTYKNKYFIRKGERKNEELEDNTDKLLRAVYGIDIDGTIVYVDIYSGEIIGGSATASFKDGASFYGQHEDEDNYYFTNSAAHLSAIMQKMGYRSIFGPATPQDGANLRNFVKGDGNNYAFAFSGHCSPTTLGNGTKTKRHVTYLTTNQVNCCWEFVFLNGCNTAVDQRWCRAFGMSPQAKGKIFMGWYQSVHFDIMEIYTKYLEEEVGKAPYDSFYNNVVRALNREGGYFHIRFWGDKSVRGKSL